MRNLLTASALMNFAGFGITSNFNGNKKSITHISKRGYKAGNNQRKRRKLMRSMRK